MQPAAPWLPPLLGGLLIGGGAWLFFSAFPRLRLRRQVADTPTSKARSAAMGPVELKGLAQALDRPLAAPFSGAPCCWWRVTVDEERVERNSRGATKRWQQIHAASSDAPFQLDDGSGQVLVLPVGAEMRVEQMLDVVLGGGGLLGAAWPSDTALPGPQAAAWLPVGGLFGQRRRLREWRIDVARPVYALGVLRPLRQGQGDQAGAALERGLNDEPFLLSTANEDELLRQLGWAIASRLAGGLAFLGVGAWLLGNTLL